MRPHQQEMIYMLKGKILAGVAAGIMVIVGAGCMVEDTDPPASSSNTVVHEKDTATVPVPVPGPSTHTETHTNTDSMGTKSTTTTTTG